LTGKRKKRDGWKERITEQNKEEMEATIEG
jgi:hypothetical protein